MKAKNRHIPLPDIAPSIAGVDAYGRNRQVDIFLHKTLIKEHGDIVGTIEMLRKELRRECVVGPVPVAFDTDPEKLRSAIIKHHCRDAVDLDSSRNDANYWLALSKVEHRRMEKYRHLWEQKHGTDSTKDRWAIFVTTQEPDERPTMSNDDGVLPRFTTCNIRYWIDSLQRWVTGREKLNAMGFPILPNTAAAAGVPQISDNVIEQAHTRVGDSMCVFMFAVIFTALFANIQQNDKSDQPAEIKSVKETTAGALDVWPEKGELPAEIKSVKKANKFTVQWRNYSQGGLEEQ